MMNSDHIRFQVGIPETFHSIVVNLFEEAYGEKNSVAIPDRTKRLKVLSHGLCLDYTVAALLDGWLVKVPGFQLPNGTFTRGITLKSLFRQLGVWGSFRAVLILSLFLFIEN